MRVGLQLLACAALADRFIQGVASATAFPHTNRVCDILSNLILRIMQLVKTQMCSAFALI